MGASSRADRIRPALWPDLDRHLPVAQILRARQSRRRHRLPVPQHPQAGGRHGIGRHRQHAALAAAQYSADAATGRITMAANKTSAITGISKASKCGADGRLAYRRQRRFFPGFRRRRHGANQRPARRGDQPHTHQHHHLDQLQRLQQPTPAGGVFHTRPQAGEAVTAGFEFDFPVRFNTAMPIGQDFPGYRSVDGVELIELLNP
jgi:hypothetical protein